MKGNKLLFFKKKTRRVGVTLNTCVGERIEKCAFRNATTLIFRSPPRSSINQFVSGFNPLSAFSSSYVKMSKAFIVSSCSRPKKYLYNPLTARCVIYNTQKHLCPLSESKLESDKGRRNRRVGAGKRSLALCQLWAVYGLKS